MTNFLTNWKKFINEGWDDDITDMLADIEKQRKAAQSGAESWSTKAGEADWKKFKQWKDQQPKPEEEPGDFKKARQQREKSKLKDNLAYNCRQIKNKVFDGASWQRIGTFSCVSLEEATQGLNPGVGTPSKVFSDSKIVSYVGEGAYGIVVLLDNGHILKIFKGGIHSDPSESVMGLGALKAELRTYSRLLKSQFAGSAKASDLSVYEFGTIPLFIPNAEIEMKNPIRYVGYAEIGKVVPFENWLKDNYDPSSAADIEEFFSTDLYDGLGSAEYKARSNKMSKKSQANDIKSFSMIAGGAEEYAEYILKFIKDDQLEMQSSHVERYGWRARKSRRLRADMPPIPTVLSYGKGLEVLKSFLVSLYYAAKEEDDEYLYGRQTRDVHTGNFGISYQTGKVIIFDK